MGIFDIFRRTKATPTRPLPAFLSDTAEAQRYEVPNGAMWSRQAELYQRLSWVNIAVTHVAAEIATLPLKVMRREGEKLVEVPNHPVETLLDNPNPRDSRYDLFFSMAAFRALTGNAYWHLNRLNERAPILEVWPIPAHRIRPVPDGKMWISHYLYDPGDGREVEIPAWQVFHTKRFHPLSQFVGLSPIEALATVAVGDLAMQRWNTAFFDKDNAKPSGILAFHDLYSPEEWAAMKQRIRDEYGGTKRALMLVQGIKHGGVEWIANTISQRDMEFLAARQFNKEEIFSLYAPGLSSILAVNATEANAEAGRKTFRDHVWKEAQAIAGGITQKILPVYGPNFVAVFEDNRITDRALELREIRQYAQTHTVDEVRAQFYEDDPIGDERGKLLLAEVGKTLLGGKEPEPVPAALQGFAGRDNAQPQEAEDADEEEPPAQDVKALRDNELATWRRYAHKHGALKASGFRPDHLPSDVAGVIKARLQAATSDEEVHAAFSGPFLVKAERITERGEVDPNGSAKDTWESRLTRLLKGRLNEQLQGVLDLLGDPPNLNNLTAEFWDGQTGQMIADLRPAIEQMARESALTTIQGQALGIDWTQIAAEAAEWAHTYTYDLVRGITDTTRKVLQDAVRRYLDTPGTTLGDLRASLAPYFGDYRAAAIATTEVTRAYAEGERRSVETARRQGQPLERVWQTARDEKVCPLCGALDGRAESEWARIDPQATTPPRHVNCRCWTTTRRVG